MDRVLVEPGVGANATYPKPQTGLRNTAPVGGCRAESTSSRVFAGRCMLQ